MRPLRRGGAFWVLAFLCAAGAMLKLWAWTGALKQRDTNEKRQKLVAGFRMARREVIAWALNTSNPRNKGPPKARQPTGNSKNRKVVNADIVTPQNMEYDPQDSFYEYFDNVLTAGRLGVSMVLGIPTTKLRPLVFTKTIEMIIDGMTTEEAKDTVIVVLVEENDKEYVLQVSNHLEKLFNSQVKSGLLEVISAPYQFHNKIQTLETSFKENKKKLTWARNNLVLAYLMMYAKNKGTFFVYLGYEIEAQKGFISIMKNYAINQRNKNVPWFILEFGHSDFVGKLFICSELSSLYRFFIAYHDRWPPKVLLDKFVRFQLCGLSLQYAECLKRKSELFMKYSYSLFEHMNL